MKHRTDSPIARPVSPCAFNGRRRAATTRQIHRLADSEHHERTLHTYERKSWTGDEFGLDNARHFTLVQVIEFFPNIQWQEELERPCLRRIDQGVLGAVFQLPSSPCTGSAVC
jgi:hypothetical protein